MSEPAFSPPHWSDSRCDDSAEILESMERLRARLPVEDDSEWFGRWTIEPPEAKRLMESSWDHEAMRRREREYWEMARRDPLLGQLRAYVGARVRSSESFTHLDGVILP